MSEYEICYIDAFKNEAVKVEVNADSYGVESIPNTISFYKRNDHMSNILVRTYFNVQYVRKI